MIELIADILRLFCTIRLINYHEHDRLLFLLRFRLSA